MKPLYTFEHELKQTNGTAGISNGVKEKPQDGKANQAVINVLAKYLGVGKSAVTLIKGKTSRQKIFEVSNPINPSTFCSGLTLSEAECVK